MVVNILGTRGIPANHGGFETFAERLALYLVQKGYTVNVYCQSEDSIKGPLHDEWNGINRIHFSPKSKGALGTIQFDLECVKHVCKQPGIDLVLGYNTALFNLLQRVKGRKVLMNMDGIEWKRKKWNWAAKLWFFLNELIGSNTSTVAIADHPEICRQLQKRSYRKPVVIPYGADKVLEADASLLLDGIDKYEYFISIARIEPENSILEIVTAFSLLKSSIKLVVLGKIDSDNQYHSEVVAAANENTIFAGAIYDTSIVKALRFFSKAYLHGHRVGGTNPSLVEALAAGNVIIAHNNIFNKWVTSDSQFYFDNVSDLKIIMQNIITDFNDRARFTQASYKRYAEEFTWPIILGKYESLIKQHMVGK